MENQEEEKNDLQKVILDKVCVCVLIKPVTLIGTNH